MNFSDERYVRVYVRDTLTWKMWHWETRSVFLLLMRKVDRSGVLDTEGATPEFALAALVEVPQDVAARALAQLVSSGTVVITDKAIVLPKFLEAQEATQSDRVRQQESRSRRKAAALATTPSVVTPGTVRDEPSQNVTERHEMSRDVTPAVPCRAVPSVQDLSRASHERDLFEKVPPPRKKPPKPGKAPDPTWQPLVDALAARFLAVRGVTYAWSPADFAALKKLLKKHAPSEVLTRWARGLVGKYAREVHSVAQLAMGTKWNALATEEPGQQRDSVGATQHAPAPTELETSTAPEWVAWRGRLRGLREQGQAYVVGQLQQLRPVSVDGEQLVVESKDKHFAGWVREHYAALIPGVVVLPAEVAS